jgi:phosphate starvation-inducible PhoH-like protein
MTRKQRYPQPVQDQKISIKHIIKPKNYSQELYLDALKDSKLTICSGPAGSGKTYLVTAVALQKLLANEVDRILLTRPVVEAGENLGFLPGTLEEKLHPYLLPLLDAIEDHVGPTMLKKLVESGKIEVAPLAYMRGRSLNNAFVILDEAQNCSPEQVKMFVTRMGFNSQFAVNGDPAQSDLPKKNGENGLDYLVSRLTGVSPDIMVCTFSHKDIVRNELISTILTHLDAPKARETGINGHSHSFNLPRGGHSNSICVSA